MLGRPNSRHVQLLGNMYKSIVPKIPSLPWFLWNTSDNNGQTEYVRLSDVNIRMN